MLNGFAGDWALTAFAMCAVPPPGLQRVTAAGALDSAAKSVTAPCPSGKRALGAGGQMSTGGGQILIDDLLVKSDLSGTTFSAARTRTASRAPGG